jgi:hypothetical protein
LRHPANETNTMGEVLRFRKQSHQKTADGKTLCRSGFHKWRVVTERKFDVKQGKLVTVLRCERCGLEKTELR